MTQPLPLEPASLSVAIDGGRLRALRKGQKLTQTELAKRAEIAGPLVSLVETGARTRVRQETFDRICVALELTGEQRRALGAEAAA